MLHLILGIVSSQAVPLVMRNYISQSKYNLAKAFLSSRILRKVSLCKVANRNCLSLLHLIRNRELDFRNVLTRTWYSKYQIEH